MLFFGLGDKNIRIILKGKTQEVKLMLLIEVKVERVFT
jgi:hypothetical protein